jgi:hypothetical protein
MMLVAVVLLWAFNNGTRERWMMTVLVGSVAAGYVGRHGRVPSP